MRSSLSVLLGGLAIVTASPRANALCPYNSTCQAAILEVGDGPVFTSHIEDCASFLETTLIPIATSLASAATSYLFSQSGIDYPAPSVTIAEPLSTSTVTATAIPSYASSACNSGNITTVYANACSCVGVATCIVTNDPSTTTLTPTHTQTVSSFYLAVSTPGVSSTNDSLISIASETYGNTNSHALAISNVTDNTTAPAVFYLTDTSQLEFYLNNSTTTTAVLSNDDQSSITEPLFFDSESDIDTSQYARVVVTPFQNLSVAGVNSANGNSMFLDCGGLLDLGENSHEFDLLGNTCVEVDVILVPL